MNAPHFQGCAPKCGGVTLLFELRQSPGCRTKLSAVHGSRAAHNYQSDSAPCSEALHSPTLSRQRRTLQTQRPHQHRIQQQEQQQLPVGLRPSECCHTCEQWVGYIWIVISLRSVPGGRSCGLAATHMLSGLCKGMPCSCRPHMH